MNYEFSFVLSVDNGSELVSLLDFTQLIECPVIRHLPWLITGVRIVRRNPHSGKDMDVRFCKVEML